MTQVFSARSVIASFIILKQEGARGVMIIIINIVHNRIKHFVLILPTFFTVTCVAQWNLGKGQR